MNYLKTAPVGIDVNIDRIQKAIYTPLLSKWTSLDIYGRVYKKTDNEGNISLERYVGNNEYKKVLFSEGNKVFFVQGDNPRMRLGMTVNDLWVVSILNIEKIKGIDHRADEEVHLDLVHELTKVVGQEAIIELGYNVKNLKKLIEGTTSFGGFDVSDIHPYHVFTVKIESEYYLVNNEC